MDLPHGCDAIRAVLETGKSALAYQPKHRTYTIAYVDSASVQTIEFCPFCGAKLPESLREEWLDRLEQLGIEPYGGNVPPELSDDRWWRS